MELRPRSGVSGFPVKPQATSLNRKSANMNKVDDVANETFVNPPSSATGVTRGGKSPSRILPAEGGRIRTSIPLPRSESAGGADRSINQSIKTHFYSAICRERIRGARRGPAPSPRANPGRRRRGRKSYARSTTCSSRNDSWGFNRTPRRRCRIYNGSRSGIANSCHVAYSASRV